MLELMRRKDRNGSVLPNWYCRIKIGSIDTKRSLGTTNKDLARKKAQELFARIESEVYSPTVPTLSMAADRMYAEVWSDNRDSVNPVHKIHTIVSIIGDLKLSQIKPQHISMIEASLKASGRSPATINRYKTALLTILHRAVSHWEVISTFPKITKAKESNMRERLMSAEEEEKLITLLGSITIKDIKFDSMLPRYQHVAEMVAVLVDTGMRLGELLQLKKSMMDVEYKVIHLTGAICKSTKGRSIPMTARVCSILKDKSEGIIYPYNKEQAIRIFHWAKSRIGVEDKDLVLHSLRHTFACRILRKGATLKQVKDLLGHADFKTTERYARYEISNLQSAVALLD